MTKSIIAHPPTKRKPPFIVGIWQKRDGSTSLVVVDARDGQHVYLVDRAQGTCTCGTAKCVHREHVATSTRLDPDNWVAFAGTLKQVGRHPFRCPGCGEVALVRFYGVINCNACPRCGFGRVAYPREPRAGNGRKGSRARTARRYVGRR